MSIYAAGSFGKEVHAVYRIFTNLRNWLQALLMAPCPPDLFSAMTPRELADLPVSHPRNEPCGG